MTNEELLEILNKRFDNIENTLQNHGQMLNVHGVSLMKIEKEVGSVQDVYKLTVDAVANTKKNQETLEQIANQVSGSSLAIKKHTQQIKEITKDIQELKLKVG